MIGEDTAVMQPPWSGQQSASGPMFAPFQVSGGMSYPRRPPPALIDMRNSTISQSPQLMNCSVPPVNCSVPPMNCSVPSVNCSVPHMTCSVPPVNCSVPPTNCSVPPVNCSVPIGMSYSGQPTNYSGQYVNYTVPQMNCTLPHTNHFVPPVTCPVRPTYMAHHAPMPQQYAGGYYQHGYWPSASGVAPAGACCGGSTPTYSQSHNNNVARTERPQKHSTRFAPYQKEMPAWITSHSYNTVSPADSCSSLQTCSWTAQQDCRRNLAEKIWRRRVETQSFLDRLNVPSEKSSCAVTQQLLNDELVRCRGATTGRGMPATRKPSPRDVSAVPVSTACVQGNTGNAELNSSSLSWLKTTSSVPAALRNMRQKSCSPLCENVSVPLPSNHSSLPLTTIDQSTLDMLLLETDDESTSGSLLTRTFETPTRDTPRDDVAPPAFDTVETMFFQKFPCSLFTRPPINSQVSSPSTEAHVDLPDLVSPCTQLSDIDTQEQRDCQSTASLTHSEGDSVPTQQHASYSSTEYYQDAVSSLDTSLSTVDSCEDRLYIDIPQLEEAATM